MSLRERFAECKGLDARGIAAALDDLDQDDITAEVMQIFGERTTASALPRTPFSIQHTMYGDMDVSDWVLGYPGGGFEVEAAKPDSTPDTKIRWEHWEDAIRLLNGDAREMGLFFTRRIASVGEGSAGLDATRWTSAVDFTGTGEDDRPGVLVVGLRAAAHAGEKEAAAYIDKEGLDRLVWARAVNMAASVIDIGGADGLAGSFMRVEVATQPPVGAHTQFGAVGAPAAAETRILMAEELGTEDPALGVTLRFESVDAFVDAVTFRQEMPQQVTNGQLRVLGAPERMQAFGEAMYKLADAMRPPQG